jgi:hypothetical protein
LIIGMVVAVGVMVGAGCARFERDWRRAVAAPRAAAPSPQGEAARMDGAWVGTWSSEGTGHRGALRCVVEGVAPVGSAATEAQFTYHARWSLFAGTFPTRQQVRREGDGGYYRSTGSWTLPRWAGGRYDYDITIREDQFTGTWRSAKDKGAFAMARAEAGDR